MACLKRLGRLYHEHSVVHPRVLLRDVEEVSVEEVAATRVVAEAVTRAAAAAEARTEVAAAIRIASFEGSRRVQD